MSFPSVSIIIPVYNSKEYVIACLDSVAHQDYQGETECLLIEDCSSDGTDQIVDRYVSEQQGRVRFRILHHDRNRKQASARNWGLKEAQGDFVFFLDSDDWIDRSALSQLISVWRRHPSSQVVQAGIMCDDPAMFPWLRVASWKAPDLAFSSDRQWIIDTCSGRKDMIPMTPVCKLMSRKFIEDHEMRFVEDIYHEDEPWLALMAKHLQAVAFCHQDLYHYRLHQNSTTGGGRKVYFEDRIQSWNEIFKLFDADFCPLKMLRQIDIDSSICIVKKTRDRQIRRRLIGVKVRLMRYCPWPLKLRIMAWIIVHSYQLL